jgi:uncharacterized protein
LSCPKVLVNASAVGYYGNNNKGLLTEASPSGDGFLAMVCREWEKSARRAETANVRVVIMRFGIVLGPDGGALALMRLPFRFGVGGVIGDGRQFLSWVHREDVARAIVWAVETAGAAGAYNLTSPNPVTMKEFMRCLGRALGWPCWTSLPPFAARLIFGPMADELLLASQQAVPQRLLAEGFAFSYAGPEAALAEIFLTGKA